MSFEAAGGVDAVVLGVFLEADQEQGYGIIFVSDPALGERSDRKEGEHGS